MVFCVHVPNVPEDLQKLWRDFLISYASALKSRHNLPIEDKVEWIELRVRTA